MRRSLQHRGQRQHRLQHRGQRPDPLRTAPHRSAPRGSHGSAPRFTTAPSSCALRGPVQHGTARLAAAAPWNSPLPAAAAVPALPAALPGPGGGEEAVRPGSWESRGIAPRLGQLPHAAGPSLVLLPPPPAVKLRPAPQSPGLPARGHGRLSSSYRETLLFFPAPVAGVAHGVRAGLGSSGQRCFLLLRSITVLRARGQVLRAE